MIGELYFNTVNEIKIREIIEIFSDCKTAPRFIKNHVTEILSSNIEEVIKEKASSAYKLCRVPVIVEHGALLIEYFNGFPGALSKPMWDLMDEKICKIIPEGETRNAKAVSGVCYCNGKRRIMVLGETLGEIAFKKSGTNGFQWDSIFIPKGETKTYAEMNQTEKLKYSQAAKAYNKLKEQLGIHDVSK